MLPHECCKHQVLAMSPGSSYWTESNRLASCQTAEGMGASLRALVWKKVLRMLWWFHTSDKLGANPSTIWSFNRLILWPHMKFYCLLGQYTEYIYIHGLYSYTIYIYISCHYPFESLQCWWPDCAPLPGQWHVDSSRDFFSGPQFSRGIRIPKSFLGKIWSS